MRLQKLKRDGLTKVPTTPNLYGKLSMTLEKTITLLLWPAYYVNLILFTMLPVISIRNLKKFSLLLNVEQLTNASLAAQQPPDILERILFLLNK